MQNWPKMKNAMKNRISNAPPPLSKIIQNITVDLQIYNSSSHSLFPYQSKFTKNQISTTEIADNDGSIIDDVVRRRKHSPKNEAALAEFGYQYGEYGEREVVEEADEEEEVVDCVTEREMIVAVAKSIEESGALRGYRGSASSLPSAGVVLSDWADEEARTDKEAEWRGDESDLIPDGLKPLRTARRDGDGHFVDHPGSGVRAGSVGRLTPVTGRENAAMGEGESDEEQTDADEWAVYGNENENGDGDVCSLSSIVNGHVRSSRTSLLVIKAAWCL